VLINATADGLRFPRVCTDEEHAVEQAYAHLVALGHDRIGLVLGPPDHVPSARKLAAYRTARAGADELVAHGALTMEEGHAAAARLIAEGATALICASDALAIGAMRAVRRLGKQVPADVSVVGFDDSGLMAFTDPPLTTVRQPVTAMGQAAVALLISQIEAEQVPDDELLFEPELVVRASTGPARRPDGPLDRRLSWAD
jgi:DNA-binding LacI/PurR family transcriptional regulator